MSSYAPDLTAEVTSIAASLWISYCCIFAGSTLVFWDHISSFSKEVQFMWGRKLNSVTLLFYLNRWTTFVWALVNTTLVLPLANVSNCRGDNNFGQAITITLFIFWAAFSAIRVYATSGGRWVLAALVCTLALVPAGTNLYGSLIAAYYQIEAIPALGLECVSGKTFSGATSTKFAVATRVCVIASDLIVLLVTWHATFKLKRFADRNNFETPVVTMLLRDGTLYFLALLILNVFNIVGWATDVFVFSVEDFTTPLSSIIISHFLMNLRQASASGTQVSPSSPLWSDQQNDSPTPSLRFASCVGNMGESLSHGSDLADTTVGFSGAYSLEGKETDDRRDDGLAINHRPAPAIQLDDSHFHTRS